MPSKRRPNISRHEHSQFSIFYRPISLDYEFDSTNKPDTKAIDNAVSTASGQAIMSDEDSLTLLWDYKFKKMNYRALAQRMFKLPKEPSRYRLSLLIFKIMSGEDWKKMSLAYPERYKSQIRFGDKIDSKALRIFQSNKNGLKKWENDLQLCGSRYHLPEQHQKPTPLLIRYGWCGYYRESFGERKFKAFEHNPLADNNYHRVLANMPFQYNEEFDIYGWLSLLTTKVNEYLGEPILSCTELFFLWQNFMSCYSTIRLEQELDVSTLLTNINYKIQQYSKIESPANEFYLRNCIDFFNDLERRKILNRCPNCNLGFNYSLKKKYCNNNCAKSARNSRDYKKHIHKRRERARLQNREIRATYRLYNVHK